MHERGSAFIDAITTVVEANNFERSRMASRLATTLVLAHKVLGGAEQLMKPGSSKTSSLAGATGESIVDMEMLGSALEAEMAELGIGATLAEEAAVGLAEEGAAGLLDQTIDLLDKANTFTESAETEHQHQQQRSSGVSIFSALQRGIDKVAHAPDMERLTDALFLTPFHQYPAMSPTQFPLAVSTTVPGSASSPSDQQPFDDFTFLPDAGNSYLTPLFVNKAPPLDFLYRGSEKPPTEVFTQGFSARGKNTNLLTHVYPPLDAEYSLDSAYISLSSSKEVAAKFPKESTKNTLFLYKVNAQPDAIDVVTGLTPNRDIIDPVRWQNVVLGEKEKTVLFKIKPHDIQGAWPIEVTPRFDPDTMILTNQRDLKNTFIENPNYQPPKSVLMLQTVKNIGHVVAAVSAVLDGVSLFNAYLDSQKYNNYHILGQESARVTGGWTGAFVVGSQLAQASVAGCAPLGLYGPPVCGVVGGVAGSVLGYMGGSSLATDAYDAMRESSLVDALFSNGQANITATELTPTQFFQDDNNQASVNQQRLPRSSVRFFDQPSRQRSFNRSHVVSEYQTPQPAHTREISFFGDVVSFFIPSAEAAEVPRKSSAKPSLCPKPNFEDALKAYSRVSDRPSAPELAL